MSPLPRILQTGVIATLMVACGGGGGDPAPSGGGGGGGGGETKFSTAILPILQQDCITCHGGAANLSVENFANLMLGGVSGAVVIPGDPDNSILIQRLEGTITPQMPQDLPPLSQPQIDTFRDWIAEGALDN